MNCVDTYTDLPFSRTDRIGQDRAPCQLTLSITYSEQVPHYHYNVCIHRNTQYPQPQTPNKIASEIGNAIDTFYLTSGMVILGIYGMTQPYLYLKVLPDWAPPPHLKTQTLFPYLVLLMKRLGSTASYPSYIRWMLVSGTAQTNLRLLTLLNASASNDASQQRRGMLVLNLLPYLIAKHRVGPHPTKAIHHQRAQGS